MSQLWFKFKMKGWCLMNKVLASFKGFWEKIKRVKHIEIYLTIIVALIIIAIYLSSLGLGSSKQTSTNDKNNSNSPTTFSTSAEYVDYLENKLDNVLSSVQGASNVNVIITLESGFEYEYATEEETKQTSSGSVTTTKLVLVDGKPVVVKEYYPTIKGIVVVAKGAQDVKVKMDILTLIQTVIEVENAKITILAGN